LQLDTSSTFTLTGSSTVIGNVNCSGATVTFTPTSPLANNTNYLAVITGAKDLAGNTMISSYRWSFTTAAASIPPSDLLSKTEMLKGSWHFWYTIISTFNDYIYMDKIDGSQNSTGGYNIFGADSYGNLAAGSYDPQHQVWGILCSGPVIYQFYYFYTDGVNVLPRSLYYQCDSNGSIISQGYTLYGNKYSSAVSSITINGIDENIRKTPTENDTPLKVKEAANNKNNYNVNVEEMCKTLIPMVGIE
jgi:hypothetical protein